MKAYQELVKTVLEQGVYKDSRNVPTLSYFNYNYTIDLSEGFPLLTTKEVSFKNILVELLWFLQGTKDPAFLERHKCKFWQPWYVNGEVPAGYGFYWRKFPYQGECNGPGCGYEGAEFDQLKFIIEELKRNPFSRRLVVSAWSPSDATVAPLPPCHVMYIFNVQNIAGVNYLNLHLTQRSADIALGVPYNIASYALLLHIVTRLVGMQVGQFGHTLVDAHIYTQRPDGTGAEYDHTAGLREQLTRVARALPDLRIDPNAPLGSLDELTQATNTATTEQLLRWFSVADYNPHPAIKFRAMV